MVKWNFLYFHLCSLRLVSLATAEKNPSSVFFTPPNQSFIDIDKIPLRLLFSWLNSPSSLKLPLCKRCSSPLIILVALDWLAPVCLCLSCTGESSTEASSPDGSDQC